VITTEHASQPIFHHLFVASQKPNNNNNNNNTLQRPTTKIWYLFLIFCGTHPCVCKALRPVPRLPSFPAITVHSIAPLPYMNSISCCTVSVFYVPHVCCVLTHSSKTVIHRWINIRFAATMTSNTPADKSWIRLQGSIQ
jgi:hypothetical protein